MRPLTAWLEDGYCSITVANHQLITVIRFVSKSYTHPWKGFTNRLHLVLHGCEILFSKNLHENFTVVSKHGQYLRATPATVRWLNNQELLKKKYMKNKTLSQVAKQPGDSHFWSGLMEVKDHFFPRGKFVVNNGRQIRFWEDLWVGGVRVVQNCKEKTPNSGKCAEFLPIEHLFQKSTSGWEG